MSKAVYGVASARCEVLQYIEATGSQYIDTGIVPAHDTRVVMDYHLQDGADGLLFGVWDASSEKSFAYMTFYEGTCGCYYYGTDYPAIWATVSGRHTIDANGNVITIDGGESVTAVEDTFELPYTLCLLAMNDSGVVSGLSAARIYSCQIYDSGVLVRDYVPVGWEGGSGLYDRVHDKLYPNAGSGSFVAGPATGEVIEVSSTTRKSKKVYAVMGGLTRKVKKGYAVISGVTRLFFSGGVSVVYTGTHTVEDATLDGVEYALYTLIGSGTLTLDGAEDNVRYWMCGGGSGGQSVTAGGSREKGGNGGSGGFLAEGTLENGVYTVVIGSGGGSDTVGGDTSIGSLTAAGAKISDNHLTEIKGASGGGTGGGKAVGYTPKGSGLSTIPFGMASLDYHSAGGGGGAYPGGTYVTSGGAAGGAGGSNGSDGYNTDDPGWGGSATPSVSKAAPGGTKGGGAGGYVTGTMTATIYAPTAATFYGSGGGGAAGAKSNTPAGTHPGGAGYQGVAYILIPKEAMA